MPIVPIHGHEPLRRRLADAVARQTLPASLLLQGPRGVGKQRLALWLGQLLLCTGPEPRPCGSCQSCRYALDLTHPDLHWFFPRPRPKDADSPEEVRDDLRDAIAERVRAHGLYAPPSGAEGLFVATIRVLVRVAAMHPALGHRKVFVIGDAERLVPQESNPEAANAFLKLLEEPPADTTIILTSSEPGALLPTIRSRVVSLRVPRLADDEVRAFARDPLVAAQLGAQKGGATEERIRAAAGAPGALLAEGGWQESVEQARRFLDAAEGKRVAQLELALRQGVAGARGAFSDTLEALTVLLHERLRGATLRDETLRALGAARAIEAVERAKELASGNVNPQLVSASLLRELGSALGSASR